MTEPRAPSPGGGRPGRLEILKLVFQAAQVLLLFMRFMSED